jgi:hypothetical protein
VWVRINSLERPEPVTFVGFRQVDLCQRVDDNKYDEFDFNESVLAF